MSKKQWKNVTENLSLQFSTRGAWSQEEVDAPTVDVNVIRSILPTKTSATRQISDLESITANGPFLLNFANIPYEATEAELKNFFRAFEIIQVIKNEQRRGSGIIEFKEFNGLAGALNMNEKVFISRPIRLTVGNKDDLARLQSGPQRNRYQNQQRTQQSSSMSDDSENWRTRKTQPVSQPSMDNVNSTKEKSNWREKPAARVVEDRSQSMADSDENWRRPKSVETKPAPPPPTAAATVTITGRGESAKVSNFQRSTPQSQLPPSSLLSSTSPSSLPDNAIKSSTTATISQSHRSESAKDSEAAKEAKKASIFGEAKPVDTTAKDLEIERKMESHRDVGTPKVSAWATKKQPQPLSSPAPTASPAASTATSLPATDSRAPSTVTSTTPEWRSTAAPIVRHKTHSESHRDSTKPIDAAAAAPTATVTAPPQLIDVAATVKVAEPVPAPLPQKNIWAERMKSKVAPAAGTTAITMAASESSPIDRNNSSIAAKPIDNSTVVAADSSPVSIAVAGQSEKQSQKPPVVISANGPFLDSKSRSSHHSTRDGGGCRVPTAVPLTQVSKSEHHYHHQQQQQHQQASAVAVAREAKTVAPTGQATPSAPTPPVASKSCGTQSSWAKGPPKGLIEKAEMNQ